MRASKSMTNSALESVVHSTPNRLSPLRRKSLLLTRDSISSFLVNDDEAERLARRHEFNALSTPKGALRGNESRRSLGLGALTQMSESHMSERISQCIKLGTENKINLKNAFSLDMIDFMTYMIKKKDTNMTNLQVASTSLDVSAKIYGFRVDGVHTDILKMIGALDKQGKADEATEGFSTEKQTNGEQVEGTPSYMQEQKKKRKRNNQRIFTTIEALKANVEIIRPSIVAVEETDTQATNMLYQAMLPNHANSQFYLHPCNYILVDTVERTDAFDTNERYSIPKINTSTDAEICPSFCNFDFQNWDVEDISDDIESQENNDNGFQFDLDASIPLDNETQPYSMNYNAGNDEEIIERCVRAFDQVENIVDFREVITAAKPTKDSEYSFIQKSLHLHWAGPSHWKINNFKKSLSNSKVIETCRQELTNKKKEITICYDHNTNSTIESKFLTNRTVKIQTRTARVDWNEEVLSLPPDKHYNIAQVSKLYLHPLITLNHENKHGTDATHLSEAIDNYNYNTENDVPDYCPNTEYDECQTNKETNHINNDDFPICTPYSFTGGNLVSAPKLTNRSSITYSLRAKKIDMRQLKKSLWTCLVSTDHEGNRNIKELVEAEKQNKMIDSKRFSNIYKILPNMLTKTNASALSFPISFVSLLHLANEKTLKVKSLPDMSDLIIEGD